MKSRYDVFVGHNCVEMFRYGLFEDTHKHSLSDKPFSDDDYVVVECPRAIYRISRSEIDNNLIQSFLKRANRMPPKDGEDNK